MPRGLLRVYLGAAPGVGKTYAMLSEGHRRRQRSTDVVIGYLEPHDRPLTIAAAGDLEVVPRRSIDYRGLHLQEMDVDAVLARRPDVVLVDELAHTNAPGSRHAKRWQDVEDLLGAGISVVTTLNVEHLESVNDVVERITGIAQRETVPDAVVRAADVELVDMSPEAIRRRMAHGNIYPAERVDLALANYFRVGNLAALRELALLWVADRVDEGIQQYRERHGIARSWETRERVVVAVTGRGATDHLVRRAARMAMRAKADLIGVHVTAADGLASAPADNIERYRRLIEEFGGSFHEVAGAEVAAALVTFARAENATQLVLGASRRSRWAEISRGSVINRVLREAADGIDVHVISYAETDEAASLTSPSRRRLAGVAPRRRLIGFALATVGLPAITVVLSSVRGSVGLPNALLCYLLLVVAVATIGGIWPALVASVAAFLLLNWFFADPIHTFSIGTGRDLLALVVFLIVAGVISALVDIADRRRNDAYQARSEAQALARMAARVLGDDDPLPALLADLVASFALDGAAVLRPGEGGWVIEVAAGSQPPSSPGDGTLALPLAGDSQLALRGAGLRADHQRLLNAFATQVAVALEARRLQGEAAGASALVQANELRSALLAAVSHDLRTPLASIKASATSLLSEDVAFEPAATKELLTTIDEETDRLNALVGNLLDMSRLQSGALVATTRPVGLEEVVASALASLSAAAVVEVDVAETLPRVLVDPALLERAVANIIANAVGFSPDGQPVKVEAAAVAGRVDLRVVDRGRGIPVTDRDRVLEPFQRLGDNPNGAGVGLGLAVANGFVTAMGGELIIEDTPGGGATLILSLPEARAQ
ncbi:MAG: two-component system, OmpR family, sensor histidine kinase KdpD [Acidimicrobiaceae bacterium]|nr:two-component system, OmpR family, sensor histidine kinase KdpD [Acidimicrobiaceae bacterium]